MTKPSVGAGKSSRSISTPRHCKADGAGPEYGSPHRGCACPAPWPSESEVAGVGSRLVFTVEQRDALRDRLLRLAEADERVVSGAAVGSLALGGGDRFSDLDLPFGIADRLPVGDVVNDWAPPPVHETRALGLVGPQPGPPTHRLVLLPA